MPTRPYRTSPSHRPPLACPRFVCAGALTTVLLTVAASGDALTRLAVQTGAAHAESLSAEQLSSLRRAASRLKNLSGTIREAAQALLGATDERERLRLLEVLIDNPSRAVTEFLIEALDTDRSTRVRLQIVNYLVQNPDPRARRVFDRLAKSDPDPRVAVAALEGLRSLAVLDLREILVRRLSAPGTTPREFLEAEERWISLVRGTMLPGFLRVPPPVFSATAGARVSVAAIGDFGTGMEPQHRIAAAMRRRHAERAFDLGVTLGDNFYDDGMESPSDPRWTTWWRDLYGPMGITFYASLGNHDWHLHDSPAAQILYTSLDPSWQMPAAYYTFTAGPVQFFAIDTNQVSRKQLAWLDEALTRSTARWKIVYGHHPIYSDGEHGDSPELIERLMPLLRNRVQLYLSGHEHDLQHLPAVDGVHFFISGGGGRDLRDPGTTRRALFAVAAYGFNVIDADDRMMRVTVVGVDEQVLYEYVIED
jgi:tartrate-resistant acid phosphatase type 5